MQRAWRRRNVDLLMTFLFGVCIFESEKSVWEFSHENFSDVVSSAFFDRLLQPPV